MEPTSKHGIDGQRLFFDSPPLQETKRLAKFYGCDMAIPNDAGIGNILVYTRVVEDLSRTLGRPLKILTGRLSPSSGVVEDELPFPLWQDNPFVREIVDADKISLDIMPAINQERDNLCQFSHMIENISIHYGIRPRHIRPSIYLTRDEQLWAMQQTAGYRRPLLCLHPHGTSSPLQNHPWYTENWEKLILALKDRVTFLEIFRYKFEEKGLDTVKIQTTIRQMMALVWSSDIFIGFDSSIAHVATAFEIPALVLWEPMRKLEIEERWQQGFAPASLSRWGYPQNKNLVLLGDRDDTILRLIIDWVEIQLKLLRA